MSGNVDEWCQDWYGYGSYGSTARLNPTGPSSGYGRVYRGGSWAYSEWSCRVSDRNYYEPWLTFNYIGFRLAL